jgi:hypothetical protein
MESWLLFRRGLPPHLIEFNDARNDTQSHCHIAAAPFAAALMGFVETFARFRVSFAAFARFFSLASEILLLMLIFPSINTIHM